MVVLLSSNRALNEGRTTSSATAAATVASRPIVATDGPLLLSIAEICIFVPSPPDGKEPAIQVQILLQPVGNRHGVLFAKL